MLAIRWNLNSFRKQRSLRKRNFIDTFWICFRLWIIIVILNGADFITGDLKFYAQKHPKLCNPHQPIAMQVADRPGDISILTHIFVSDNRTVVASLKRPK